MEGADVLIRDSQDFVCLVCLDHLLGEVFHLLRGDRSRECYDEVVIQVANTVLRDLVKVGLRRLNQVNDRDIWDTLALVRDILVHEDVAVAQRPNIHDRSDDVLAIRVKNERFKCEESA